MRWQRVTSALQKAESLTLIFACRASLRYLLPSGFSRFPFQLPNRTAHIGWIRAWWESNAFSAIFPDLAGSSIFMFQLSQAWQNLAFFIDGSIRFSFHGFSTAISCLTSARCISRALHQLTCSYLNFPSGGLPSVQFDPKLFALIWPDTRRPGECSTV